jgi:hypothetical protein
VVAQQQVQEQVPQVVVGVGVQLRAVVVAVLQQVEAVQQLG